MGLLQAYIGFIILDILMFVMWYICMVDRVEKEINVKVNIISSLSNVPSWAVMLLILMCICPVVNVIFFCIFLINSKTYIDAEIERLSK